MLAPCIVLGQLFCSKRPEGVDYGKRKSLHCTAFAVSTPSPRLSPSSPRSIGRRQKIHLRCSRMQLRILLGGRGPAMQQHPSKGDVEHERESKGTRSVREQPRKCTGNQKGLSAKQPGPCSNERRQKKHKLLIDSICAANPKFFPVSPYLPFQLPATPL